MNEKIDADRERGINIANSLKNQIIQKGDKLLFSYTDKYSNKLRKIGINSDNNTFEVTGIDEGKFVLLNKENNRTMTINPETAKIQIDDNKINMIDLGYFTSISKVETKEANNDKSESDQTSETKKFNDPEVADGYETENAA